VSVPFWVSELADAFWQGASEPFPRSLRLSAALALPVLVTDLPGLGLRAVSDWLQAHGGSGWRHPVGADRPLRACLVARDGWGYVFVDADDPEDERRFSLAHELAHFLRHYLQPRIDAGRRVGQRALEVLDGRRPATTAEHLRAVLLGAPLACHVHLLARSPDGSASAAVDAAEREADRLAFELLAPAEAVLAEPAHTRAALAQRLCDVFGLPPAQAWRYAGLLRPEQPTDPLLRRLGLAG
jgi:hypothetical protein